MKEIITNGNLIKVKSGEKITISSKPNNKPYYKVGNGNTNTEGKSMNLIQEMIGMSKPELFLIGEVESKLSYFSENSIGIVKIDSSGFTSTEKQYITTGYKKLREKKILIKVSRGEYMINPSLIMPRALEEAEMMWEELLNK